jgi:trigger factor
MQITVEELSPVKKKINFAIPAERVSLEIDKAYDKIRKKANVKGFRKGKAPISFIEKHYSDAMAEDVLHVLFNDSYYKALMDNKLVPASHPMLESDTVARGQELKFSATVEVVPEIKAVDYKGLVLARERYVEDPTKVDARLEQIRDNMAQFVPAGDDHVAAMQDMVTMDFEGFLAGEPFAGGKGEDSQLVLGSGNFIPGFEEQIVGMKAGDAKEITVTFPTEYHAKELAGQEATFAITIKELKVREVPAFDDDFARELGDFETMDQVRARLTETIEKQEKERIEADFREQLLNALVERNPLEVPESLVERQLDMMLDNSKKRLESQRLSLAMMGLDEEQYKAQFRDVAVQKVKSSLLLETLARLEEIKVEESDIEAQLKKMADESGQDFNRLKEFYSTNRQANESMAGYLLDEKVFALIAGSAEITEAAKA